MQPWFLGLRGEYKTNRETNIIAYFQFLYTDGFFNKGKYAFNINKQKFCNVKE